MSDKKSVKSWICVSEDKTTIFGAGQTPQKARELAEEYLRDCGEENKLNRCKTIYAKVYVEFIGYIEGDSSWKHLGEEE